MIEMVVMVVTGVEVVKTSKSSGNEPWLGGSVSWSVILCTKRLWVQFLVRAHTLWV